MFPFNFNLSSNSSIFALATFAIWVVYLIIYWRAMITILRATRFTTPDKILWFLVITLAPVIGIITFYSMCPPHVLDVQGRIRPSPPSD